MSTQNIREKAEKARLARVEISNILKKHEIEKEKLADEIYIQLFVLEESDEPFIINYDKKEIREKVKETLNQINKTIECIDSMQEFFSNEIFLERLHIFKKFLEFEVKRFPTIKVGRQTTSRNRKVIALYKLMEEHDYSDKWTSAKIITELLLLSGENFSDVVDPNGTIFQCLRNLNN